MILSITSMRMFPSRGRSACPPPASGDKEPVHCACLICVTGVVCAEIDVAFHSTVCGPCLGSSPSVCLSLLSPARCSGCNLGRGIYIDTDVGWARCYCVNVSEGIKGLKAVIITSLTCQELHTEARGLSQNTRESGVYGYMLV